MKSKLTKQDKEILDNRIVLITSVIFAYAILLLFVQRMALSTLTVNGAIAFLEILRWVSLGGAMACAAWSAYKEKRGFFIYCGICSFIFFSTTIVLYCNAHGKAYYINYMMLFLSFVAAQVYYALKARNLFEKKAVRVGYLSVCLVLIAAVTVVCLVQRFS